MSAIPPAPIPFPPYKIHGTHFPKTLPYSAVQPFANRFRTFRLMGEHDSGTGALVLNGLTDPLPNGYPNSIPGGRVVRAYKDGNADAALGIPTGNWVVRWSGGGTVAFNWGAGGASSSSGRITHNVTAGEAANNWFVEIQSLPVSNIAVFYEPYESWVDNTSSRGLDPDFCMRLYDLQVNAMRFSLALEPNKSVVQVAADRKPEGYFTESNILPDSTEVHRGCTFQMIADVAHVCRLRRVQVQIPRLTWNDPTHSYLYAMIDYLLASLPDYTDIELEVGNEVWNAIFPDRAFYEDAGVNGIPGIFAARTNGTNNDKMIQAFGHRCEEVFRLARARAGSRANRIKRTIAWQATNTTTDFFRMLTNTGQSGTNYSFTPFPFDHFSVSFYYANQLSGTRVHTVTGQIGTFAARETLTGTGGPATLGYVRAGKLFIEGAQMSGLVTGASSGATATVTGNTAISPEIETWTPLDFYNYSQHDVNTRVFGAASGIQTTAAMAAARSATFVPYEGGKHEWPSGGGYTANAITAIKNWYRDAQHAAHVFLLLALVRQIANSEGHGYWFDGGGEFDWNLFESYLDDGGIRPGVRGVAAEAAYQAFKLAGDQMLGNDGSTQSLLPGQPVPVKMVGADRASVSALLHEVAKTAVPASRSIDRLLRGTSSRWTPTRSPRRRPKS